MEDILRLLNERERQSEDAFDNFSKLSQIILMIGDKDICMDLRKGD